ncbi:MAG: hypothetical protein GY842_08000, partial [bacterium]|nr:hypothetical protein [bacterium]
MPSDEFERLRIAWARAYPNRARGGPVSIRGFWFQYQSALRDAVRAWAQDPQSVGPVVEALSDIAGPRSDGSWTITQVKLTGTSGSIRKALEELWTICQVAAEETPSLADRVTYEVRCAQWDLKNVQRAVSAWTPATPSPPGPVRRFRDKVRVTTDPHPLRDVVEDLVQHTRAM